MTRFLPIILLLSVICYLLSISPSFAQEITPGVTSSQVTPKSGDPQESLKNPFVLDSLSQTNCSNLPFEACTDIDPRTNYGKRKTQAQQGNLEVIGNAAGQYVVAAGIHTPTEIAGASTNNVSDFVASIIKAFRSIFDTGEKQAKNYAETVFPQNVNDQNFAQGTQKIGGIASENSNILGIQSGLNMDRALLLVQCAELPKGFCSKDNIPNFVNK